MGIGVRIFFNAVFVRNSEINCKELIKIGLKIQNAGWFKTSSHSKDASSNPCKVWFGLCTLDCDVQWTAFISIQWRRIFWTGFIFYQAFFSNYKFISKQREAANLQLFFVSMFMCVNAGWKLGEKWKI